MKYTLLLTIFFAGKLLFAQNGNDPNMELINDFKMTECLKGASEYVFYDSTIANVKESGLSYVNKHQLIKILDAKAAKEYRQVTFDYDPLSAFVKIKEAKIYRNDGTVEKLTEEKFIDIPAPARAIYWGARKVIVNFGRLEPGDVIETKIFRKGFTYALLYDNGDDDKFIPPMKGHYYDIVEFWSDKHIGEKVYKLFLPQDKPLQWEFYNGEVDVFTHFPTDKKEEKVHINPHKNEKNLAHKACTKNYIQEDNKKIYCWVKRNIKPFKGESNMVAKSNVAPKLLMSTTKDWYAKATWFYNVNKDFGSFEVTPAIQEKVDELLEGVTDEMEKISILTHWCAENIRYSGISMGEGEGYTLHKGEMTFKDRCGVCKDKAGMLITMLRAAGFESYAAMTMAGSRIDRIPADQFNHSITVAKLANDEWILLDPTWVPGVRELWSSAEQQQGFLMGIPGGSDLMYTPISPAKNHYWRMNVKSKLDENGKLTGTIKVEAEGQSDAMIRRAFGGFNSGMEEYLPALLHRTYPQIKINSLSYPDIEDLSNPIALEVKFEIPDFALKTKNGLAFKPLAAENPFSDYYNAAELYIRTSDEEKDFGFKARCSKLVEIAEDMQLPAGYKTTDLPESMNVEGKPANFNAHWKTTGNMLVFMCKHEMSKRVYKATDWPVFRESLVKRKEAGEKVINIVKQ